MGKASRRRTASREQQGSARAVKDPGAQPAPFVARPFAGLPGETDWVALREVVPAATATVRLAPGAVPGRRARRPPPWPRSCRWPGPACAGSTARSSSGCSPARPPATPAATWPRCCWRPRPPSPAPRSRSTPLATAGTPRLQDVLDLDAPFEVTVHEGFDFWVTDAAGARRGGQGLARAGQRLGHPDEQAARGRLGVLVPHRRADPPALGAAARRGRRDRRPGPAARPWRQRDRRQHPAARGVPRLRAARPGLGAGRDAGGRGLRGGGRRAGRAVRRRARGRGAPDRRRSGGPARVC